MLGSAARLAGLALVIPSLWWVSLMWRGAGTSPNRFVLRSAALWFALAGLTTAIAGAFGSPALLAGGRQGVVIHLHALFAGFVTPLLAMALSLRVPRSALVAHHGSLAVMLVGLSLVASGGVVAGMWVAAAGSVALWLFGVGWSGSIILRRNL